jgi:CheY-like chemotaxis protein
MALPEADTRHKVLLVDDDKAIRTLTTQQLEGKGFQVVAASSVAEALRLIATETFDALITDLNMPNAGDGFTVATAMRHSQPEALILLVSGYPDVGRAMATIALEPDEIIVKPFDTARLSELVSEKLLARKPASRVDKLRVSVILHRCVPDILKDWLARAKLSPELNHLYLTDEQRTGHLPKLIEDLVAGLKKTTTAWLDGETFLSISAAQHGQLRSLQGYTAAMLVQESRILQVTLFEILQKNLRHLDFSLLLPDVMKIADEVDAQLMQTVASFTEAQSHKAAARSIAQIA